MIRSTRFLETMTGLAVIVIAVAFLFFGLSETNYATGEATYIVSAEFDNANGIARGTEVRMSGVRVGQVRDQHLDPETFFAIVEMEIDHSILLPQDTSVRILSDGLLGGAYVSPHPRRLAGEHPRRRPNPPHPRRGEPRGSLRAFYLLRHRKRRLSSRDCPKARPRVCDPFYSSEQLSNTTS